MYSASQFAKLSGVTVRALHHYDRLGLLKPRRTAAGYRAYTDKDLERLEQIVALKFLGVPLRQIHDWLDRHPLPLNVALRAQRRTLEEQRRRLDRAIEAIDAAGKASPADLAALLKIINEVMEMDRQTDWMEKYFSEAGRAKANARRPIWSPELQERVSRQWTELIAEVEGALGEDPASEKARELAARWMALVNEFTGGDEEIAAGVGAMWRDRTNWPRQMDAKAPVIPPEVWSFIQRAMQTTLPAPHPAVPRFWRCEG